MISQKNGDDGRNTTKAQKADNEQSQRLFTEGGFIF